MRGAPRKALSTVAAIAVAGLLITSGHAWSQAGLPLLERQVHGQTITSLRSPAVEVTADPAFTYVGGQRVTLYGNADAELHLFAKTAAGGIVQSFYWIQFEHFLPSNSMRYDPASSRTLDIGGMSFYVDGLGYLARMAESGAWKRCPLAVPATGT